MNIVKKIQNLLKNAKHSIEENVDNEYCKNTKKLTNLCLREVACSREVTCSIAGTVELLDRLTKTVLPSILCSTVPPQVTPVTQVRMWLV